ncbi:unnamed protein product [Allacma fusca]|uniref:Uncharacterized protein n=1 Tax=Allacma fusca TaxID=39272 RepID=A0A8J2J6D0_9HEXA|nr:unnamed protein product [Allacma fusca]
MGATSSTTDNVPVNLTANTSGPENPTHPTVSTDNSVNNNNEPCRPQSPPQEPGFFSRALGENTGVWSLRQRLVYFILGIAIVLACQLIKKFYKDLTGNFMGRTAPPMKGTLGYYKW